MSNPLSKESEVLARNYRFSYQGESSVYPVEVSHKVMRNAQIPRVTEELTLGHRGVSSTAKKEDGRWVSIGTGFIEIWGEMPSHIRAEIHGAIDDLVGYAIIDALKVGPVPKR